MSKPPADPDADGAAAAAPDGAHECEHARGAALLQQRPDVLPRALLIARTREAPLRRVRGGGRLRLEERAPEHLAARAPLLLGGGERFTDGEPDGGGSSGGALEAAVCGRHPLSGNDFARGQLRREGKPVREVLQRAAGADSSVAKLRPLAERVGDAHSGSASNDAEPYVRPSSKGERAGDGRTGAGERDVAPTQGAAASRRAFCRIYPLHRRPG